MDDIDREDSRLMRAIPNIISALSILAGIGVIGAGLVGGNVGWALLLAVVAVAGQAGDGIAAYYLKAENVLGLAQPLESVSGFILGVGVVGTLVRVDAWSFWFVALPLILVVGFLQAVSFWPQKFHPKFKQTQNWFHPLLSCGVVFWGIVTMLRLCFARVPDFHDLLVGLTFLVAFAIIGMRDYRKLPLFGQPDEDDEDDDEPDDYVDADLDDEDDDRSRRRDRDL
jgi:hypothetical protein